MAKVCPVCGTLPDPVTREVCKCGHEFASVVRPVLAPGQPLLCPSCGRQCSSTAKGCTCGYGFDEDPDQVHHMLMHKLTVGWIGVIGGMLLIAVALLSYFALWMPGLVLMSGIGCGSWLISHGTVRISRARGALELYKPPAKALPPPKAIIVKR